MIQGSYRFVLQALDPDHGSPILETLFSVTNLEDPCAILGSCANDAPFVPGAVECSRALASCITR